MSLLGFTNPLSALPSAPTSPIPGATPNRNSLDFVSNWSEAIRNCSIVIPNGVKQIGAFAFDYKDTEQVELDSEITDHWLEDNTAAQDHIGVKPAIVTLSGFVSELTLPHGLLAILAGDLQAATNGLTQLPIFLGTQTPGAVQAMELAISQVQSAVVQVEQTVARAAQIANVLSGLLNGPARNKQQTAFLQLQALQQARIIFTVVTPYQTFYNMAIEALHAVQPPDSQFWSKFTVRLKQLNFVGDTGTPNYAANLSSPVASAQGQAPVNLGPTAGRAAASVASVFSVF